METRCVFLEAGTEVLIIIFMIFVVQKVDDLLPSLVATTPPLAVRLEASAT
jgi:hypothetical protein